MLHLSHRLAEAIRVHGAESYPHECCGALLGRAQGDGGKRVEELQAIVNRRQDSPRNRFLVTAEDYLAAEKAARARSLEIVGWYHSHPDHPARPSDFDREHAWPGYSYVIVAVADRQPGAITSWTLRDDRSQFDPETLIVAEASVSSR
ncbi:MAG TPA: M67 family metallopeptidase [Candidatus Acidoferrales bacterium]